MWKHVRYMAGWMKKIYTCAAHIACFKITSHAKRFIELFLIDGIGMCGGACDVAQWQSAYETILVRERIFT